jgi:hypothetical protein
MKGDFTRRTFKPQKHYSSVQMQQGRVQLDSDWNEEVAIIDHRWRATLEDTVGPNGSPKVGGGFGITAVKGSKGEDLLLSLGRLYVDGILCEADSSHLDGSVVDTAAGTVSVTGVMAGETKLMADQWIQISAAATVIVAQITNVNNPPAGSADSTLTVAPLAPGTLPVAGTRIRITPVVTYLTQPDLQSPPAIDMFTTQNQYFGKTYIAYLDVFQGHIIAIDDPAIREVALNGPDTGTRTRTTWQVRLVEVDSMTTCADLILPAAPPPAAGTFAAPVASTGRMRARAIPTSDPVQDCLLPAEAGFRRLENQLYRVEIHQPGDLTTATFKWSRDNGSVAVDWKGCPKPGELTIAGTPQDAAQGFESGQWVELTDDVRELSPGGNVLGIFVQLAVPDGDTLKYVGPPALTPADYDATFKDHHPKGRRWESDPKKVDVVGGDGWILLEDGVEVQFPAAYPQTWFNKGDYWLIPARTATTDVEWPNDPPGIPVALRPHGIEHRYCALALIQVHSGGQITTLDCRPQFPALTAIAATDVSYDNSTCQLINATNVQQALDALCKVRVDLSHHNKLIHGYGIVCGLQVVCNSATGEWVTVKSGYAVDCNGNDVETTMDTPVDVGLLISQMSSSPLDSSQNGEVSLIIGVDKHAQVQITAEKYKPPTSEVDELFDGTLLLDYYVACIKPIQDFMTSELDHNLTGDPPITSRQEVASSFINLLAQGPNPQAGQNVYISTHEHAILKELYYGLKEKLSSDTFCALFDNARKYPNTSVDDQMTIGFGAGMTHGFGMGQQARIKWRPDGTEFYTLSNGNDPTKLEPRINQYDAKSGKMIAQTDPTGGAITGRIIDFTFSVKGDKMFVILASASQPSDTLFQVGSYSPAGWLWSPQLKPISGFSLAAIENLGLGNQELLAVIATGKAKGGLYYLQPDQVSTLRPIGKDFKFDASGHMAVAHPGGELQSKRLFIAATHNTAPNAAPAPSYDTVRVFEIPNLQEAVSTDIHLPAAGSDGLVWGGAAESGIGHIGLYVVVGSASKTIAGYTGAGVGFGPGGLGPINPAMTVAVDSCPIRMAADRNFLWWASQDFYTLNRINLAKQTADEGWTLPMQVGPVDIALAPTLTPTFGELRPLLVLNRPADSVLLVPHTLLYAGAAVAQDLLNRVVAYHKQAVEAYVDLLAGFVQYLKDCFCDHLLVKCAECNPRNEKLYLGVVSIRANKVHNVCNFSGRHYLKTFPTIGYWMSLFPIVPIIGELIELICCYVIPDAAAKYSVPQYNPQASGGTPAWSLDGMYNTFQEIQKLDLRSQLATWLKKFGLAKHVVGVGAGFRQLAAPPAPGPAGFVAGASTTSATGALAQLGMAVQAQPFIPSLGPPVMANLIDIFRRPAGPSGPIALHQTAGQVLFTSNPPSQPSVASLQQQLLAKDALLQQVQTQLVAVNSQLAELHAFRQQVTQQLAGMAGGSTPAV